MAESEISVEDWNAVRKLLEDMETVGGQASEIEEYATKHVCDKSGFEFTPCALQPLADQMDRLAAVFTAMQSTFDTRWEKLIEATAVTMRDLDLTDGRVDHDFSRFLGTPEQPGRR